MSLYSDPITLDYEVVDQDAQPDTTTEEVMFTMILQEQTEYYSSQGKLEYLVEYQTTLEFEAEPVDPVDPDATDETEETEGNGDNIDT